MILMLKPLPMFPTYVIAKKISSKQFDGKNLKCRKRKLLFKQFFLKIGFTKKNWCRLSRKIKDLTDKSPTGPFFSRSSDKINMINTSIIVKLSSSNDRWQHYSAKIISKSYIYGFVENKNEKTYSLKNARSGWCKMSGLAFIAAMNCCNCTSCCLGIPDIVDRPYFCGMTKSNKRLFCCFCESKSCEEMFHVVFWNRISNVIAELFWQKYRFILYKCQFGHIKVSKKSNW